MITTCLLVYYVLAVWIEPKIHDFFSVKVKGVLAAVNCMKEQKTRAKYEVNGFPSGMLEVFC